MEKISCLCVTRGRLPLLIRAVELFNAQTYGDKELILLYERDDRPTRRFVRSLRGSQYRKVEVFPEEGLRLGGLFNKAKAEAQGDYLALWDDDDWSHPQRLKCQISEIDRCEVASCCLSRITLWDGSKTWVSWGRPWEGTCVWARGVMADFANEKTGWDTAPVLDLWQRNRMTLLNRPDLFCYCRNNQSVNGTEHFDKLVSKCQPLSPRELSEELRGTLSTSTTW